MYMVLCIDRENMHYYSMLYYALETWERYYNNNYDVFVSVSSSDFNIWNEEYLGLNITKRFPNVIYYKSDFDKSKYNVYLHKWYDIDKVFAKGYESIFQFDVDSIFYEDISYIFDKYNKQYIYSLTETYNPTIYKILSECGKPSGQQIISNIILHKVDNLFLNILEKRNQLIEIAKQRLNNTEFIWFKKLSEQYSAQKVFNDFGVEYRSLNPNDIGMGVQDFKIECIDDNLVTNLKYKKAAAGYMSANYHLFLPNKYLDENAIKRKLNYCKKCI